MIVFFDKNYEKNNTLPNTDFSDKKAYVIDENTENGKMLAHKIIDNYPYYDFVLDDEGHLIDIVPTERPPQPPQPPSPDERLETLELAMLELLA